jgi:sRNA-binding protein
VIGCPLCTTDDEKLRHAREQLARPQAEVEAGQAELQQMRLDRWGSFRPACCALFAAFMAACSVA